MIKRRRPANVFYRVCYLTVGALASYSAYRLYKASKRPPAYKPITDIRKQPDYEIISPLDTLYDEEVSFPEFISGISRRRIQLTSLAKVYFSVSRSDFIQGCSDHICNARAASWKHRQARIGM